MLVALHPLIHMPQPRRKGFNFGDTFDRSDVDEEYVVIEIPESEPPSQGTFSDICDYCGRLATDILNHLKIFHPKKYEKLVFE